jgi:tetratricopeptide (TPR) repeat protein
VLPDQAIANGFAENPDSDDLWQGHGFNYYNNRQYTQSVDAFKRALEINPGYGEAHMGIRMVYAQQNQLDEALVHLNRATRDKAHLARAYAETSEI